MLDRLMLIPNVQNLMNLCGNFVIDSQCTVYSNSKKCIQTFMQHTMNVVTPQNEIQYRLAEPSSFYYIKIGNTQEDVDSIPDNPEGYHLKVDPHGILIVSRTEQGLFYGCCTWHQILKQTGSSIPALQIDDWPTLPNRGLLIDVSRGRVFTIEYLKKLVKQLARLKMNVLQLYIEHTFQFPDKEEIWEGSGAYSREEIITLRKWCEEHFVELQANLQSFGHCNRILTTKGYRHLRESDLYWTLSPAKAESYQFLESLYDDYLPLFTSSVFNVNSDETYDLGTGASKALQKSLGTGRLYLNHLLKLRDLAKKHGKQIMAFGDVIIKHPELIQELPDDIVFLDWIYDPKDHYDTPAVFGNSGKQFWVCPGTGSWNSLFPRQEGATKNIIGLVTQGITEGAKGMLLCDWADHGGYAMPKASEYSYAVGAVMSWTGYCDNLEKVEQAMEILFDEPVYRQLNQVLASIHRLPGVWSKNRSECVIALFDEPLTGRSLTAPVPPKNLQPMKELPEGIGSVFDEESQHMMRPIFQLTDTILSDMNSIVAEAETLVEHVVDKERFSEYKWIVQSFRLIIDKVRLGRIIRTGFSTHQIDVDLLLDWEIELRLQKQRFVHLQIDFTKIWLSYAKISEIDISLTYFAHVIERIDYLQNWIRKQRLAMQKNREPDYALETYNTAGYRSLPTY